MNVERINPLAGDDEELLALHRARYQFASGFVRGKRTLDIACGTGYGTEILSHEGSVQVLGVDISLEALMFARKHYASHNVIFLEGNAEQIPDVGKIDIVISFETIEHLQNPNKFLEGIKRILPKEGMLIISTPIRSKGTLETEPDNPFHVREWNENEFMSLLSSYAFKCDPYYQFVIRKKKYPGSRTVTKIIANTFAPLEYAAYFKFPVTKTPSNFRTIELIKGYLIVVCVLQ